ncbi:S-layer homology domain-containing protein [Bacillus sp. Marseille-P3661]|uniref:S-layer homology domain-containing protein n=1 Tax=Bacillus sp. Marseille-P3661 TaxID=1936234 RepID=UPI000C85A71A|nr:S-layer homology domain-containing protein [Bacillus sp. Marseille-P3661]
MKKWMFILVILLLTITNSVQAAAVDDITGHYFETEIRTLDKLGIMNGDGQGHFFPNQEVTRAQFAAFLNRSLQLPKTENKPFVDVEGHGLAQEINNAAAAGLINGVGEGKFLPNRTLTREEVALMVSRVLNNNGLTADLQPLNFTDTAKIKYADAIQPIFTYGIMNGYGDGSFRPQEGVTRGQTAKVIMNMYKLLEKVKKEREAAAQKEKEKAEEEASQKAEEEAKQNDSNKDEIDDSNNERDEEYSSNLDGPLIVIAKKLLNIYENNLKSQRTYVNVETEMKYIEEDRNSIKVELAGATGYVKKEDVKLVPESQVVNRAYYKVVNGHLRHYLAQNGRMESYIFGRAPSFMDEGDKDYSFDGRTFSDGTFYQYFNYMPVLSETSYSGEDLDEFVASEYPESPLIGLGDVFKDAEEETGVNALYLLAHAIHESAWGYSKIATDKFNLYGLKAIDADAYNAAMEFDSFEDSIFYAANYVKDKYLIPGERTFYFGSFLGNKGAGMNMFYASDPFWGQKIAGYMYRADRYLGNDDYNRYTLAMSKVPSLNVRTGPSTNDRVQYDLKYAGVAMVVLDEIKRSDGVWYKIKSDHPDYEEGYIYASGSKGEFAEIIN